MGLLINENKHQGIYKNNNKLNAPNQVIFKRNHLSDLLEAQQRQNNQLYQSILQLKTLNLQQDNRQMNKWEHVSRQLNRLESKDFEHKKVENDLVNQLSLLVRESQKLQERIESEQSLNNAMMKEIEQFEQSNDDIKKTMIEQKDTQLEILNRLDNQEALTEKALRQISNLRSTLYERTSFIAEKVEESFKMSSAYLYHLLTDTDQSLTLYLPKPKNK